MSDIWLNGTSFGQVFLYDTESGTGKEYAVDDTPMTSGSAIVFGRDLVALFLAEKDGDRVVLQVGQVRLKLDGTTKATVRRAPLGASHQRLGRGAVRRLDPAEAS